jgi:hypothetical protein
LDYLRFTKKVISVVVLFISSSVLSCAEDDGFIKESNSKESKKVEDTTKTSGDKQESKTDWTNVVDPRLQRSYEEHQREQRLRAQFSKDIARFATLKKKTFDMVALIHKFDLKGPHYDPTKFDELTKWMRIYEKEILIAMDNYDAEAYVFFFEEFAKLTIQRAGMVNPNCDIKDCECRNYKN